MTESSAAPSWLIKPTFRDDLFQGTAEFYALYRQPYPATLLDDLMGRIDLRPQARLLDMACGTGEIAIPLHDRFHEVLAVDLEAEMVAVGRRKAEGVGADNIRWSAGRAEDIDVAAASLDLVTVGNAFHRLDRPLIGRKARGWLADRGSIAVMGTNSVWTGVEPWQLAATEVIKKWTDHPGRGDKPAEPTDERPRLTHQQALEAEGFTVTEHHFPTPYIWTLDSFIGYLSSTSVASKTRESSTAVDFESELKERLLAIEPSGEFHETSAYFYLLGHRA